MDGPGRSARPVWPPRPAAPPEPARRRARRLLRETAAVTPVVGTIMILAISAFGIGVVMAWGLPSMKQTQTNAEVDAVFDQFHSLEEMLQNIMRSGASGKASSGGISFSEGDLRRTEGNLFVLSAHLETPSANDTHRYRVTTLDAGDPYVLRVEAIDDANITDRYVDAYSVDPDQENQVGTVTSSGSGVWDVVVPRDDIGIGTLRVRVMHEAKPEIGENGPFPLMESWAFQMGALEYTRQTEPLSTQVILEMGSVVTTYPSGSHVHTDPLVRRETNPDDDTTFLSFFAPTMTGGPDNAPLESSGPGTHPIRLLLNLNMLQIAGQDAREVDLQIVGERSYVWYEHFEDRHGWTLDPSSEPGSIERAIMVNPREDPLDDYSPTIAFEFALMESRIHAEMQEGASRID